MNLAFNLVGTFIDLAKPTGSNYAPLRVRCHPKQNGHEYARRFVPRRDITLAAMFIA
jgi:hypothetical protein